MNRLRIVVFSLLVLTLIAGALPVTDTLAKWSRSAAVVRRHRRHRRHSRAWWRRHRALAQARRERAEQRRQQRLAGASPDGVAADGASGVKTSLLTFAGSPVPVAVTPAAATVAPARTSSMPFDFEPPHTWTQLRKSRAGETVFAVQTPDGRAVGTAVFAPVSLSAAQVAGAPSSPKSKTVGGLSVAALRRTVIDRMVTEGGWVTNDFVKEMHGRRVLVVTAQTGAPGSPAQSWTFYFTEIDGRVYSLATAAPVEFSEPVAAGSEQFMASLRSAVSKNLASQK